MTNVTLIRKQERAALIEWQGQSGLRRSIVPVALLGNIEGRSAVVDDPEQGIPYGIPWAEVFTPAVTPEVLEAALYQAGLWTLADIKAHPNAVLGALQAAYGLDLASLLRRAETYENRPTWAEED